MRVLQIAPPWFAVPPRTYGGTEWIVSLLADGLVDAGHDVELLASGGSITRARLRTVYDEPPSASLGDVATELGHVLEAYLAPGDVDLIHDHSGFIGPALGALARTVPVVHTLHGAWTPASTRIYRLLSDRIALVAISHDQARRRPAGVDLAGVVHNGLDARLYPFCADKDPFLLWVGRASPDKGPEVAIEVARRVGLPLAMALKVNEVDEHLYLREVLEPAMTGQDVTVVRNASLEDKVDLMERARCVLFPAQWPEPFGLVMLEAMACGTPVVAYANGATPEVIADGQTGYVVPAGDLDALCAAVEQTGDIDPQRCRDHVERAFSAERMVAGYLEVYAQVLGWWSLTDRTARVARRR